MKMLSFAALLIFLSAVQPASAVKNEGEYGPVTSPDGKYIAYHKNSEEIVWDIMLREVLSGKVSRITDNQAYDTGASWSPDSQSFVYSSSVSGNREIYRYSLETGKSELIVSHPSMDNQAIWSPEGDKIAFLSRRSGTSQLHLFDLASKNVFQLTEEPGDIFHPSWAKDGKSLYFDRNAGKGSIIYKIDLKSKKVEEIFQNEGSTISAVPFKDGLMVTSNVNGDWDIFKVDIESSLATPLIFGKGHQMKGTWHEKSRTITYSEMGADGVWRVQIKQLK